MATSGPGPRHARSPSGASRVGIAGGLVALAALVALVSGVGTSAIPGPAVGSGRQAVGSAATSTAPPGGTPSTVMSPSLEPSPVPAVPVALVPVVAPSSPERSIARADIARALSGPGGPSIAVASDDLAALAATLGVSAGANVRSATAADVRAAVTAQTGMLGILRAADVTPDVRALAVDGRSLFGAERVHSLEAWPLLVPEAPGAEAEPFDPAAAWTLVAGGDVMLDRAVYRESVLAGKGADFPWDGGTAEVVGWTCCGASGVLLPVGRRTGGDGAVRSLLGSADVALVNLEGPAPDDFTYHPGGLVFTFDPALLVGLRDAGVDIVSMANNHISNAGATGIADTVRDLDALGLAHAGAGADLAAARRPAIVRAGGLRVAVLAYDTIRPDLDAAPGRAGAAPLRLDQAAADIRAARAAGADVVVVMPHWGIEYTDAVSTEQRREAAALVAAGADAVLGSHSHWVGPLEAIDGRPVLYSLGDLVFELTHDQRTMEGALADLTFVGRRLVQLDLHPTLILDGSQPNLLDPAGDGAALLGQVRSASTRLGGG